MQSFGKSMLTTTHKEENVYNSKRRQSKINKPNPTIVPIMQCVKSEINPPPSPNIHVPIKEMSSRVYLTAYTGNVR